MQSSSNITQIFVSFQLFQVFTFRKEDHTTIDSKFVFDIFAKKQGFKFDYCFTLNYYFLFLFSQDLQASVEKLQDGLFQEVEELPTAVDDNMLSSDAGRSETQDKLSCGESCRFLNQSKWIHMFLYNFIQIPVSKQCWLLQKFPS